MQEFRENARMMSGTTSSGSSNTSSSSNGFKIVSIEGNIGSGKSTLIKMLKNLKFIQKIMYIISKRTF